MDDSLVFESDQGKLQARLTFKSGTFHRGSDLGESHGCSSAGERDSFACGSPDLDSQLELSACENWTIRTRGDHHEEGLYSSPPQSATFRVGPLWRFVFPNQPLLIRLRDSS